MKLCKARENGLSWDDSVLAFGSCRGRRLARRELLRRLRLAGRAPGDRRAARRRVLGRRRRPIGDAADLRGLLPLRSGFSRKQRAFASFGRKQNAPSPGLSDTSRNFSVGRSWRLASNEQIKGTIELGLNNIELGSE